MIAIPCKDKLLSAFSIIPMLLLIVLSSDSILVGTNESPFAMMLSRYFPFALAMGLFIYCILKNARFQRNLFILLFVFVLGFLLTLAFAPGNNSLNNTLHHIALILSGFLIVSIVPFEAFMELFERTMFFLAVFSLFALLLAIFTPQIVRMFPVITNTAKDQYFCLGLSVVRGYGLINNFFLRNFGLFREPGVFQVFLNIALCYYLFSKTTALKILHVLWYGLAILSTTSTTGIIAMFFVFIAFFTAKSEINKKVKFLVFLLSLFLLIFLFSGTSDKLLYAMMKITDSSNASTVSRIGSIYANLHMFFEYPIFGIGQVEQTAQFSNLVARYTGMGSPHNTNTILYTFSCHGVFLGTAFLIGFLRLSKRFTEKSTAQIILCIFICIILSGENWIYSYFSYVFLMYGCSVKQLDIKSERGTLL